MLYQLSNPDADIGLSDQLLHYISSQELKSGDRLPPERSLAKIFGVTRGCIRKAIQSLAALGLLEKRQGSGTFVSRLVNREEEVEASAARNFREIMEIRSIIEPKIAELACGRWTPDQLDQLKIIACDQQRRLLTGEDDGDLDARFHYCFALCSGNRHLSGIMKWINELYRPGRNSELRDREWRQFSVNTHLRIIDALERRSVKECKQAVEEHLAFVVSQHPFFKEPCDCPENMWSVYEKHD